MNSVDLISKILFTYLPITPSSFPGLRLHPMIFFFPPNLTENPENLSAFFFLEAALQFGSYQDLSQNKKGAGFQLLICT